MKNLLKGLAVSVLLSGCGENVENNRSNSLENQRTETLQPNEPFLTDTCIYQGVVSKDVDRTVYCNKKGDMIISYTRNLLSNVDKERGVITHRSMESHPSGNNNHLSCKCTEKNVELASEGKMLSCED